MSAGFAMFLYAFANVFVGGEVADLGALSGVMLGLIIVTIGLLVWWRQDMSSDGIYEPKATGAPFRNIDIRKASMHLFDVRDDGLHEFIQHVYSLSPWYP